jgi:urease accessory protein
MLRIELRHRAGQRPSHVLTLPFDKRQKSRLRAVLDSGHSVSIQLERGTHLAHGDLLETTDGQVIEVRGASETLSRVGSADPLLLARAAYHLGNRHVAVEIRGAELFYQHDHVLDGMLRQLGLEVSTVERTFEPEAGAYGSGHAHAVRSDGHGHGHGHGHAHHHHEDEDDP